jgi:hypothetical protein
MTAERMAAMDYKTQVIYGHPEHGRVLWATVETNIDLVTVACIESGRMPILDVRPYSPMSGPAFACYDDENEREMRELRGSAPAAELQSTSTPGSRAAEILRGVGQQSVTGAFAEAVEPLARLHGIEVTEARPATRTGLEPVFWQPHLDGMKVGQDVRVTSSSGRGQYTVTVRDDTFNGGTYAHCTCPSWPTQRGRGRDCKHINEVAIATANGRKELGR